mmetsp:Transcript_13650/g.23240  ORF Transcript_13650/g.23240 Transcript_13650/m.23240 type:complete len:138 (-) Transcript_13650:1858-2271(-)
MSARQLNPTDPQSAFGLNPVKLSQESYSPKHDQDSSSTTDNDQELNKSMEKERGEDFEDFSGSESQRDSGRSGSNIHNLNEVDSAQSPSKLEDQAPRSPKKMLDPKEQIELRYQSYQEGLRKVTGNSQAEELQYLLY